MSEKNSEEFEHQPSHGIIFSTNRCDFENVAVFTIPLGLNAEEVTRDVPEMIAYHTVKILPKLNKFRDYN